MLGFHERDATDTPKNYHVAIQLMRTSQKMAWAKKPRCRFEILKQFYAFRLIGLEPITTHDL